VTPVQSLARIRRNLDRERAACVRVSHDSNHCRSTDKNIEIYPLYELHHATKTAKIKNVIFSVTYRCTPFSALVVFFSRRGRLSPEPNYACWGYIRRNNLYETLRVEAFLELPCGRIILSFITVQLLLLLKASRSTTTVQL